MSPFSEFRTAACQVPAPHPVRGGITVAVSLSGTAPAELVAFDTTGRCVWRGKLAVATGRRFVRLAPPSTWSPGVYLLRLLQENQSVTRQVIVLD